MGAPTFYWLRAQPKGRVASKIEATRKDLQGREGLQSGYGKMEQRTFKWPGHDAAEAVGNYASFAGTESKRNGNLVKQYRILLPS